MANYPVRNPWRSEVAIDLGTAFVRVATERFAGVSIPTALTSNPPLRSGVIADPQAVTNLLRPLLARAKRLGLLRPRVLVGTPTDATGEEREALTAALLKAGAARITIVSEPLAAALGAGLDILSPYVQMIVDVGEGVTDCAIIRAGEILESHASRVGCANLRERIRGRFHECWGLCLTTAEVEWIVATVGTGNVRRADTDILVRAGNRGVISPETLTVRPAALQSIIEPLIIEISNTAINLLRKVPPALGCEIIESGIVLTGGGALLPGLRERLAEATHIKVTTPTEPLDVVIKGLEGMLMPA